MDSNSIYLSKSIYKTERISRAIRDFSGLVRIETEVLDDSYVCHMSSFKTDKERTILEFENYLISLSNQSEE